MANNAVLAATTLFLLLLTLTTADTDNDLVLDVEGDPLEVGSEYYIQQAIGFFGGIGRSGRDGTDLSCPLYVLERRSEVDRGNLVKFVPVDETQKEIHVSSDVKIDSGKNPYCRSEGIWRVILDTYSRSLLVIASGSSSDTRTSFRIEKIEGPLNAYKIVYPFPTTRSPEQGYLTVFSDRLSGLNLVRVTDDSTQAVLFVFYKNKKDVVVSI